MKTKQTGAPTTNPTELEIPTIDTVQLEDVTGGCGACGNPNCGADAAATTARPNLFSAFGR